jgi:hypothetical protein
MIAIPPKAADVRGAHKYRVHVANAPSGKIF